MKPTLKTIKDKSISFQLEGEIAQRLENVINQWILPAPYANPVILEMFRERNIQPSRDYVPWAGEFAGKYLTHSVEILRLTGDKKLYDHIKWFVSEVVSLQNEDGYLGPWPDGWELTGKAPNAQRFGPPHDPPQKNLGFTWDAWGHYHLMLGLMKWHDYSLDKKAFSCVKKIADLFVEKFIDGKMSMADAGCLEMNLAPIHSFCLLYQKTKNENYLKVARQIEKDFESPKAGDYIRQALDGVEFYKTPKPRWESLHPVEGIAELYYITSEDKYRKAFEQIWWSIVKHDRHNNGGFSSGEAAQGSPYALGAIETCCTVAWMAMSVDMLKLTGNSIVADELELSLLNSGLGMMSPSGRWVTYNTPMDGNKCASAHTIVFQARAGQPELNCCSVNGPRALGLLSEWAVMNDGDGVVINYYGPGKTQLPMGNTRLTITQTTTYPKAGNIEIKIDPGKSQKFNIKLRIPYWSAKTRCSVNGKSAGKITAGEYLTISRIWKKGDIIKLSLDMSLHYWKGQKECGGKVSIFRGPILLTADQRFNVDMPIEKLATLDAKNLKLKSVKDKSWMEPWMLWEVTAADDRKMRLCDFASAGNTGLNYKSWLKVRNIKPGRFSPINPLRSSRD